MNKRLIWNFEINSDNPLQIANDDDVTFSSNRWEARYFWPGNAIITLHGLNDNFLDLSRYKIKHRDDTYCLLPNLVYNIKIRREQLFYKPILIKNAQAIAYDKKIPLKEQAPEMQISGCDGNDAQTLIALIENNGIKITVEKEVLIYTFETSPPCKLELARLLVANKSYYSACIESRSYRLVESIAKKLFGHSQSCDYVTFLRGL